MTWVLPGQMTLNRASSHRYSQGMAQKMQDWLAGFAPEIGISPPTSEELDVL